MLTIVATGANGYESGKDYNLVISAGKVDGVSVIGEAVGGFTLGRSAAAVDLANGTDGLGVIKGDTAAILLDTGTDGVKIAAAQTVATVTTLTGHTPQTGDSFARIGVAGAGLININLPDQIMDITGNLSGSVGSLVGHTPQTGDTFGLANGANGFVSIDIKTTNLPPDPADQSLIIAATDANLAAINALNDFDPTAQLAESYAANGVAPTSVQIWFAIHQMLMDFGITGTTWTVRKLDGLATAFVVTLDDATNPTDAKRV